MQIIELYIKGYKRINGGGNAAVSNQLIDSTASFLGIVEVGDVVTNRETDSVARVTAVVSDTELTLNNTIFTPLTYGQQYRIESDYFRADLFKDESISITDTLLNVKDISKVFTPFSQQFNLPASKLNNKLFRHYENTDIENSFDARFRHDAIIKLNGVDYKKGKIQFKSVSLKDNKAHAYKVVFYGDTVELKEVLGETKLSGLNYGDLDFLYNSANINNLFTNDDATIESIYGSTDIQVPNIHHSKNMRYSSSGYEDNITGTELIWTDLKPAIRLRAIIEAINRTYSQINLVGFFESSSFKDVFMWMHRNEGYITNAEEGGDTFIVRNRWGNQTDEPIGWNFLDSSPSTIEDIRPFTMGVYTYLKRYRMEITITTGTTESYTVNVYKSNTSQLWYTEQHSGVTTSTTSFTFDNDWMGGPPLNFTVEVEAENTIALNQTLKIVEQRRVFGTWTDAWYVRYTAENEDVDKTFYVAKQMPDMKVMDFLSGLFKMFNLVVFKDGDNINVQRASFYMNQGTSYDITKYVDMSSASVERIFQYKAMEFKFKSKKSFLVQYSDEIQGNRFAEEDYGDNEWDGGIYNVELPFEKMMYERLNNETTGDLTYIGQGAFLDKKFEPTIGEPLLFCMVRQANTNNELTFGGSTPAHYRRPTQLTSFDWGFTTRLQLNFGEEADEWEQTQPSQSTNLFESEYYDYVETVFDPNSRMFKYTAYLPLSILLNYNLNDKFIIANKSFRINSIKTNLLTNKTDLELYNKDEYITQLQNNQYAYLGRVGQLTISSVFKSEFLVSWSLLSEPTITNYDVYLNGGLYNSNGNTTTSQLVDGLDENTEYTVSVRVKYSVGYYSFDTVESVTTNNITPP